MRTTRIRLDQVIRDPFKEEMQGAVIVSTRCWGPDKDPDEDAPNWVSVILEINTVAVSSRIVGTQPFSHLRAVLELVKAEFGTGLAIAIEQAVAEDWFKALPVTLDRV